MLKIIRYILFPISLLYGLIIEIRNTLFDNQILKSSEFDVKTILVGNISAGGTGKTPHIEYLIRLLKPSNKVATLSRGYGRKTHGFITANENATANEIGDEPLQFFTKFKDISVHVGAKRVDSVIEIMSDEKPPEVILLDDAFQHRKVTAKSYILLTKFNDLFSDDFLLPTGTLRESRSGAKRASVIIVTKCPENLSKEAQYKIIKKIQPTASQKVFFTTISYDENLKGTQEITISELKDKDVLLVTGIANPTPLEEYLKKEKINFKHLNFPDHHNFSDQDIEKIKKTSPQKIIVTTEKDYMRLENKLENVVYISIKSVFLNEKKQFDDFVVSLLNN